MADKTGIQWTDATWNPIRGCSRVSPGCENCYAERQAARFSGPGMPYDGLARIGKNGPRWTGKVRTVPEHMLDPVRWQRPRRIFVNSMSDLFHEGLTNEQIATVFGVMVAAPQHVFQVLTKRARRMREWFEWLDRAAGDVGYARIAFCLLKASEAGVDLPVTEDTRERITHDVWPMANVWVGVSVENQAAADERIDDLLRVPARVRFLSCEPLLGPVNIGLIGTIPATISPQYRLVADAISWVIVGGESGPGARTMDIDWARALVAECKDAQVACFMKQLGANHFDDRDTRARRRPGKGDDPALWPAELRVRQFPGEEDLR